MALYSLAPNDVCMCQMFSTYLGEQIIYTFHYYLSDATGYPDGPAAIRSLANKFFEMTWTNNLKVFTNGFFTFQYVKVQIVHPTLRVFEDVIVNENGQHATGDPLPPNTAFTIARRGSIAGRGRNSSLHLAGWSTDQLDTGGIDDGVIVQLNGLASAMVNELTTVVGPTTWKPIIWGKLYPTARNELRSAAANPYVRVQRRRTVGLGK
jgi:hypothetical protein